VSNDVETENAMLREVFTETQVIFEDSRIDFVDVRVPRPLWLRLRAWRAADRGDGRSNRFALFSDEELYALAEMTSSRTTSEGLSLHRRRMMGQVQLERQRRSETS
jgi:hypothetical protein